MLEIVCCLFELFPLSRRRCSTVASLIPLVERHGLHVHLYADDTQIYGFSSSSSVHQLQMRMSACIDDVAGWMSSNRLQQNTSKTEVLWCSSTRRHSQRPSSQFRIGGDFVAPSAVVRDLGIYIDSDVSMHAQVSRTVSSCFSLLRQLRTIRRSLSSSSFQSLVVAMVLSRLDYGNATLAGISSYQLRRLQAVMNSAARLVDLNTLHRCSTVCTGYENRKNSVQARCSCFLVSA